VHGVGAKSNGATLRSAACSLSIAHTRVQGALTSTVLAADRLERADVCDHSYVNTQVNVWKNAHEGVALHERVIIRASLCS
jgi:hypothetical protein